MKFIVIGMILILRSPWAFAAEGKEREPFHDEIERSFPLVNVGTLKIFNRHGSIKVEGWAQDRVQVHGKRIVHAESVDAAEKAFAKVQISYQELGGDIELTANYGFNSEIRERIRDRKGENMSRMDLIVYAPAKLKIDAWTVNGSVQVFSWKTDVQARSFSGGILISDVKAENVNAICTDCSIQLKDITGNQVRAFGGTKPVLLENVKAEKIYSETRSGEQEISRVSGDQSYISKEGAVFGNSLEGNLFFQNDKGPVRLKRVRGVVNGKTTTGDIEVELNRWDNEGRALIETGSGNVELMMPPNLSSDVQFWAIHGVLNVDFPVLAPRAKDVYGPEPINLVAGTIGSGGGHLKVLTENGNIHVLKGR